MDLKELELSDGILRMSRNASALAIFASGVELINLPKVGFITYMSSSVLILFIGYILNKLIKQCLNVKKYNQNVENISIKKLRNMINSLMDEKLKEELERSKVLSIGTFVTGIVLAIYSMKMEQPFMGLSASTFLLSSLFHGNASIKYQQLMNEVGIEEKTLTKTKMGPEF